MHPPLLIIGIDPGTSSPVTFAVIGQLPQRHVNALGETYHLYHHGEFMAPLHEPFTDKNFHDLVVRASMPMRPSKGVFIATVVETGRGIALKNRDNDGLLTNNIQAGRLISAAESGPLVALHAPAFGPTPDGFTWRDALGITVPKKGKSYPGVLGDKDADAAVRRYVNARLDEPLPLGTRGGQSSHVADAAGIAIATLDRLLARGIHDRSTKDEVRAAFWQPTTRDTLRIMRQDANKATRRTKRKLQQEAAES